MQGYGILRAIVVVLLAWLATAFCAIVLFETMRVFVDVRTISFGLLYFVLIVTGGGWITMLIGNALLFDVSDSDEFHVFCGTGNPTAGSNPRGATWPFAKLSVTNTTLRFQSAWSDRRWTRQEISPTFRRSRFTPSEFSILDGQTGPPIKFRVLPWRAKQVENALRSLNYRVEFVE